MNYCTHIGYTKGILKNLLHYIIKFVCVRFFFFNRFNLIFIFERSFNIIYTSYAFIFVTKFIDLSFLNKALVHYLFYM